MGGRITETLQVGVKFAMAERHCWVRHRRCYASPRRCPDQVSSKRRPSNRLAWRALEGFMQDSLQRFLVPQSHGMGSIFLLLQQS
ncbi:unnamed protein product [Linum tenue]|uniref:Uncharacterized protein n=1 Tax=Linum tenue TaxID=586396 RepID=A0AAV0NUI1_9ROSI|nr:unnamed protein product [Linum tenue]